MAKEQPSAERVNVTAGNMNVSGGGTVGIDRSKGKSVSGAAKGDVTSPAGFLAFALKELPVLVWAVGVGGIVAIVAIVAAWGVSPGGLVLGSVGLFVGMFGLLIFAALLKPSPTTAKPPIISQVTLWAFGLLLIGVGFLSASSVFFDWPIPLRSQLFPQATAAVSGDWLSARIGSMYPPLIVFPAEAVP